MNFFPGLAYYTVVNIASHLVMNVKWVNKSIKYIQKTNSGSGWEMIFVYVRIDSKFSPVLPQRCWQIAIWGRYVSAVIRDLVSHFVLWRCKLRNRINDASYTAYQYTDAQPSWFDNFLPHIYSRKECQTCPNVYHTSDDSRFCCGELKSTQTTIQVRIARIAILALISDTRQYTGA